MANLKQAFFENGAEISYRCWGLEGGRVLAKWDALRSAWMWRHESDENWASEPMSEARARYYFPTDGALV
jgi:hypothetical protein